MDTGRSKSYLWSVPQNHTNPPDLFKSSKRTMFKGERQRERRLLMQVVSFSRDVYHILQLDLFDKIPTSEMALKQRHKT